MVGPVPKNSKANGKFCYILSSGSTQYTMASHLFYLAKTVGLHFLSKYLVLILLVSKLPTIAHKISKTNSSFHVK